ncbi:MAG: hypothetical protein ACRENG_00505 [bacterium]
MQIVNISYDLEGDILEVRFAPGEEGDRTGIGLNEDVTIFCNRKYSELHGLTVLAYSKLLSLPPQPLTELKEFPSSVQKKIRALLQNKALQPFLSLENGNLRLLDVRVAELAAA